MAENRNFLVSQLNDIFERLTSIYDFIKSKSNLANAECKLIRCNELKKEYESLRKEILKFNSLLSDPKLEIKTRTSTFDEIFDSIQQKFMDSKLTSKPKNENSYNLQPLRLPFFDGKIENWTNFKGLFDSLIHNNSQLSDIEKLHYLKTHLSGEALLLLANIEFDKANYKLCYDMLNQRYTSSRRLINFYISQLLNFNSKESREHFLSSHVSAIQALKNLKLANLGDCVLFNLAYRNLCPQDKQAFDNQVEPNTIPTTEELFTFIRKRIQTSEFQKDTQPKFNQGSQYSKFSKHNKISLALTSTVDKCCYCNDSHRIYVCPKFTILSVPERKIWVRKNNRCFQCLGNHLAAKCLSKSSCKECNLSTHHSLLHETVEPIKENPQCFLTRSNNATVLLGTLKIFIQNFKNQWVQVRALMDTASQVNLMTSECLKKLGLNLNSEIRAISGISCNLSKTLGTATCIIDLGNKNISTNFTILHNICSSQPNFVVSRAVIDKFRFLELADKEFHSNAPIDILLGAELVSQLISRTEPSFIPGNPSAIRTHYGYVLLGKIDSATPSNPVSLYISNDELDNEMRKFWELEDVKLSKIESPEETFCEDLFCTTYTRDNSGRYQVRLPIKPDSVLLTSNRQRVYASYIQSEKRLLINPHIKIAYDKFLTQYLESDFMEIAKTSAQYLHTHHAVFKDSSSTSLRVVINGSTPDSENKSLNSILYPGPKLQSALPNILDNFRSYPFVIIADISKMFSQILIHPEDRHYQHIFWRSPISKKIDEYELKRLSFGHVSSPWLALRVMKQLIIDEGSNFPTAAFSLDTCTYIDDILTGADSISQVKLLIKELNQLLQKGGFELKKWISNCPEILNEFSESDLEAPRPFNDDSTYYKVLGVTWLPKEDVFSFNTLEFTGAITKRNITSYIARLFDPCGWCAPVILKAKTFIQKSWCLKISWDEEILDPLASQWKEFVKDFHLLQRLKIKRNLKTVGAKYRLLGFSDGSKDGYGCCVYLQTLSSFGSTCNLLRAKSRVCPLKTISIPRIELLGAHLLTKLIKSILHKNFPFLIEDIFYFTDSEIVLYWISSSPHTLKTFVANRITDILEKSNPSQWRHVSSQDNPADPVSRGLQPTQLLECSIYWNGPSFISKPVKEWLSNPKIISEIEIPEIKSLPNCLNTCDIEPFVNFFSKFSSLTKLQNVMAYINRFIFNCKSPQQKSSGPLSVEERKNALYICAQLTQKWYFRNELDLLQKGKPLPGPFQKLTPFIEKRTNLIRAGGRLKNSSLHYNAKHPILLPKDAHFSKLICNHFHLLSIHSGATTVQALIQKEWWIFGLRNLLRKCIFSCQKCYKLKSKPLQPFMADLPAARTRISRVFSNVGTDFCGPFTIKESSRRNSRTSKAYLCIFVCLCTKAVHLEVVSELSTAAFMACFDRFVSRRSLPTCVFSDRGTNYQGAHNKLKEISEWLETNNKEIYSQLASRLVQWKFSPPNAPNFGGIWESVVKSSKTLLLRMIGTRILTFEELSTIFSKIEAVLNSRPLTPLSTTPDDDLDFLTPGHFLVGGPLIGPPEENIREEISVKTRWKALQQITQSFWKRWSSQYLFTLMPRSKWTSKPDNLKNGQLVYVSKLNTAPMSWPLGRVVATHPGKDGTVRVVTVKTANGNYLRPSNSLIPLPVS